jgi:hypothetical protein
MTSQAETVELLVRKANFSPQAALAVAEAIDNAMTNLQLVTVPILDARLAVMEHSLRREIAVSTERLLKEIHVTNERTKSELVKWVLFAMLGSTAIGAGATAVTNAIQHYH